MASRRVLGFALSEHHNAQLAYDALTMAVAERGQVPGVMFHTDQGSEYTAGTFRAACQRLGIRQSMGRPGSALDKGCVLYCTSWRGLCWDSVPDGASLSGDEARVAGCGRLE
jgi:transposase InsO family protein